TKATPMVTEDDDLLDGRVPSPDEEPTPAERAHAKTFADLVDKTLAGRTPPAMSADDRALLEVATAIRAAAGNAELAGAKRTSIVEAALRQGVGVKTPARSSDVVPISRARKRAPWIIAASSMAVAAAALILWLRAPHTTIIQQPAAAALPDNYKSRPADPLIGPIGRDHAGDASARLDTIFADRLDGYRELRMRGGRP
ncbi:MAG: hypothetical protein ABI678_09705, partial [Kofleriaceae bacterium]